MKKFTVTLSIFLCMGLFVVACADGEDDSRTESDKDGNIEQTDANTEETNMIENTGEDAEVITIKDRTFVYNDLEFYELMNKVKIELYLEADLKEASSDEAKERKEFWSEQREYYDNLNVNLQSLIETYAMSLLAEEKNYFVPEDKLEASVAELTEKIEANEAAKQLVEQYGEKKYKQYIREYVRQITLRDRIATELKDEIIEENPDLVEQDINYMLEQQYQDLYSAHLATLELDIHIQ